MILNWQGYAMAGTVGLAVGFGGGWKLRDLIAASDARKAAVEAVKQANKTIAKTQQSAVITQGVGERVEKAQVEIRYQTREVVRNVPFYVTKEADRRCDVPLGFVRLHDASATGKAAVPYGSGESADTPSGLVLSTVSSTVGENYGYARELEQQVIGWQSWYAEQKQAWEAK